MRQIAAECGISVAAVSMALRGHPRISDETVVRVTEAAKRHGYRTNPLLRSVMSHVRAASAKKKMWLNIAFVWLEATPESVRSDPFESQTVRSVEERAAQLGLHLEQFFLSARGMSPKRLEQIILARGISGVIFSPSANIPNVELGFAWDKFSVVVIGNCPWSPEFHRAGHHHYRSMCRAITRIGQLGYIRPALILEEKRNERAWRTPEAGFLTHYPGDVDPRKMIFRMPDNKLGSLKRWLKQSHADCLVFPFLDGWSADFKETQLGKRYPYAALDIFTPGDVSGIHWDFKTIGANAVDLLMNQLLHLERGVPARAHVVLAEGAWHPGSTLPPKLSAAALLASTSRASASKRRAR